MESPAERILRRMIVVCIFAVPFIALLVVPQMYYPFLTPKGFAFRIIVELMAGAWIALALVNAQYRPKRSLILGAFASYLAVMAVANLSGVNPHASFFGDYSHMDGWFNLAHVFVYVVIVSTCMTSEKLWRRLFQVSLGVSALVSIYGILQLAGVIDLITGRLSWGVRIGSTLGNPSYLAIYLLFHIFIAALLLVDSWESRARGRPFRAVVAGYGGILALDVIVLFLTGTRGTVLGLLGGGVVSLALFAFIQKERRVRWVAGVTIALLVVSGGMLFFAKDTPLVRDVGPVDRLVSTSLDDPTVSSRLNLYEMSLRGFSVHPLLGWGQENFNAVFFRHVGARTGFGSEWDDRPHDVLLERLIDAGMVGLIAYLLVLISFLWVVWKEPVFSLKERSILTGLLAGYFIHNLFMFDTVEAYILVGTVFAYVVWRETAKRHPAATNVLSQGSLPYLGIITVALSLGAIWATHHAPISANILLQRALTHQEDGVSKNLDYFRQATSIDSFGRSEARFELAKAAGWISTQDVDTHVRGEFLAYAKTQLESETARFSANLLPALYLGEICDLYGDYANGKLHLERANSLSPSNPYIIDQLATNAALRGDNAAALGYLKEAYELNTENVESRLLYAMAMIYINDLTRSDELLAPLLADGSAADDRIVRAYLAINRPDKVIALLAPRLRDAPRTMGIYKPLVGAYFLTGDIPRSIQTLEVLKEENPATTDRVDALISSMRGGAPKATILAQIDQLF